MKVQDLRPIDYAPKCKVPAMFIHGIEDNFIEMTHTEQLFSAYGGEVKDVQYVDGDHNSVRPQETLEYALNYLKKHVFPSSD